MIHGIAVGAPEDGAMIRRDMSIQMAVDLANLVSYTLSYCISNLTGNTQAAGNEAIFGQLYMTSWVIGSPPPYLPKVNSWRRVHETIRWMLISKRVNSCCLLSVSIHRALLYRHGLLFLRLPQFLSSSGSIPGSGKPFLTSTTYLRSVCITMPPS